MPIEYDDDAKRRWPSAVTPRRPDGMDCDLFTYLCWAIVWSQDDGFSHWENRWILIDKIIERRPDWI